MASQINFPRGGVSSLPLRDEERTRCEVWTRVLGIVVCAMLIGCQAQSSGNVSSLATVRSATTAYIRTSADPSISAVELLGRADAFQLASAVWLRTGRLNVWTMRILADQLALASGLEGTELEAMTAVFYEIAEAYANGEPGATENEQIEALKELIDQVRLIARRYS